MSSDLRQVRMRQHVVALCKKHRIRLRFSLTPRRTGWADRPNRTVCVNRIKSSWTYLMALHEIAHVVARGCSYHWPLIDQETAAWQWAIKHSLVPLDVLVFKRVHECLVTYAYAKEID